MSYPSMKNPLRTKLEANAAPTHGVWITLTDPTATELVVELGVDWIVVDMEHGSLDYKDVLAHARAARGSDVAVLTRLPTTSIDGVKRAFDLGIDGVVLPLIHSAEELEAGFRYGRYPARGVRGIGGERSVHWGLRLHDYLEVANRECMVIPLIETKEASADFARIVEVEGLEAIFFGPADLSASQGYVGQWQGPGVADDILRITEMARAKGIVAGVIGWDDDDVERRAKQGFRMIGLGSDVGLISRQLKALLTRFKGTEYGNRWL